MITEYAEQYFSCILTNGDRIYFNRQCNFIEYVNPDLIYFKQKNMKTKEEIILEIIPTRNILRIINNINSKSVEEIMKEYISNE